MKHSLLFIALSVLINIKSIAQQPLTIIPPSPDAAALGIYGNIPISKYTGIPNINIPLYNIDHRDVHIPISLSYHASGITVEQDASWVGLGFALNIGGVITRSVRGGDDMQFANDGFSNITNFGYQGYPYDNQDQTVENFLLNVCTKTIDPDPDMFYFNFSGKSGAFVLESGQSPAVNFVSGTPINAEKIEIKYDKTNLRWQIRTSDGYTYYFGTIERTESLLGSGNYGMGPEYTTFDPVNNGFFSYDQIVVSAWYMDRVVTPLGEEVHFIYDVVSNQSTINSLYGSARISISETNSTRIYLGSVDECYTPGLGQSVSKIFTNHIYLKEIQFSAGRVVLEKSLREDLIPPLNLISPTDNPGQLQYINKQPFFMNWANLDGPQKLDNILILDNTGAIIKKFALEYSYFNNESTGIEKYSFKRLKLNRLRECSEAACKPYYVFSYDETYSLPSKYSNAQDFWGYYNGAHSNVSKIPYGTFYYEGGYYYLGDSDRQPNGTYLTTATLNRVQYPTGGSTEFEFEPHDYYAFESNAFKLTDFKNNEPVPVAELSTIDTDPQYKTIQFTLSEPVQDVILEGTMTYMPYIDAIDLCDVTDPGTVHIGNELWYSLSNISTSSEITSRYMSDYLSYFESNYANNCLNSPQTPNQIDPIYRDKRSFLLGPGTYELKVYSREDFNIKVEINKKTIQDRIIPQREDGVFAKMAGGLRIKKITSTAATASLPLIKRYDYTSIDLNGQKWSTGKLMLFPDYHVPYYCENIVTPDVGALVAVMGHSWSNTPLGTSASGSIVGYDRVSEFEGEGNENGHVEHHFINEVESVSGIDDGFPVIEGLPTKKNNFNGLITNINYFNADGNVLKSTSFTYLKQLSKTIEGMATKQLINKGLTGEIQMTCSARNMIGKPYYIESDRWSPSKKTERIYNQPEGTFLEMVTDYEYDATTHLQLKSEQTSIGDGSVLKTINHYPPDASWIPTAMWMDKFIYDKVVLKEVFRNNILNNTYKAFYTGQANTFLLSKEESSVGSGLLEPLRTYDYTTEGNVLGVVGKDGVSRTYLWGYGKSLPIAEITNAEFETTISNGEVTHLTNQNISENGSLIAIGESFESLISQNVSPVLDLYVVNGSSTPPSAPQLTVSLYKSGSSVPVKTHNCIWGSNNVGSVSLSPGVYQWYYDAQVSGGVGFTGYNLYITTNYTGQQTAQNVFYTSFEDNGALSLDSKTGRKIWSGVYSLTLPGVVGDYQLSYWTKTGSDPWTLIEQIVNGNAGVVQSMDIGSSGSIIDDVRLHPVGSVMTTYTYDPLIGITSVTDTNNSTTYYEYDALGRLEIMRDTDENIVKHYKYSYKDEQ